MRSLISFTIALILISGWTGFAFATPVALTCGSLQGSVIFSEPFQTTSGGCSTGSFTGSLENPLEGVVTARVSFNGNTISHHHDIEDIGSGTNWLVSTQALFSFTVTPEMESITLQASSSPSLEETFLQIQGPVETLYFLGGGWQSSGSPPSSTSPLGGNTLELPPGTYTGFYRFKTYTSSGHKVSAVSLSLDATIMAPVPEPNTALLVALGLVGFAADRRRR
jgi:hypothetical protein